jgi:hypothetical protein
VKSPRPIRPEPWLPPPQVPRGVIYALKALAAGKASEGQQKQALSWLVYNLCGVTRMSFDPRTEKVDGRRVSDFTEGQQSIGKMLSQIIETPVKGDQDREIPSAAGIEPPNSST